MWDIEELCWDFAQLGDQHDHLNILNFTINTKGKQQNAAAQNRE